jgi:hypothetical protein
VEEFDAVWMKDSNVASNVITSINKWIGKGNSFIQSKDSDKCYQLSTTSTGAILVTPIPNSSRIRYPDVTKNEGHILNYFLGMLGTFLRKFPDRVQYGGPADDVLKMRGAGPSVDREELVEQLRMLVEKPLEEMSTMKELNELLSDRLEPVQSEPVQS